MEKRTEYLPKNYVSGHSSNRRSNERLGEQLLPSSEDWTPERCISEDSNDKLYPIHRQVLALDVF